MRTVELVAKRRLEVASRPDTRDAGPGEVVVRLHAVGICGSDLHWYEDGGIGYTAAVYPMILGHEPVGEVVSVGKGVTTHKLGERVAIEPSIVCGECEFCRSGRPNNCVECVFMGGTQAPGFFRDYAAVPARNAEHFPETFSYAKATLIEPTAVIVHVFELFDFRPGDTVAVLGAGPIGILSAVMAKLRGASQVFIADKVPHRLQLAASIDPTFVTLNTKTDKVTDAVLDMTRQRGVDVVLDAAGALETINTGMAIARLSGQYVLIGIPTEQALMIDIHTAMAKELRIQTIKRSNHKGHDAIHLIADGKIPESIITHRLPLEKTPDGFAMLSEYRDGVGKTIIELD
jgi:L-iditol 2-dehydrogenase